MAKDKDDEKEATPEENKTARSSQNEEMKKLGLTPHSERVGEESDEDEDSDEEDEKDEEESKDETDDSDEDEEDEDEEEDEDSDDEEENEEGEDDEEDEDEEGEEGQSHKKKGISFKQYNQMRSDLRTALRTIRTMAESGANKKGEEGREEKQPLEDFSKRIETLSKEIGVENPEGLKKIMQLVAEIAKGESSKYEKKLSDLEEKYGKLSENAPIEDGFDKEWKSFEKDTIRKQFPNVSEEELEEASNLMYELSHSPKTGGIAYKEGDKELLNPFPLDYIFYKNQGKFKNIITGKKVRGMEHNRSQGITRDGKKGGNNELKLAPNSSDKEIRAYEKRARKEMGGMDSLGTPVDDSI